MVKHAVPFMVGDSYKGRRLVGTSPQMFGFNDDGTPQADPFEYRKGRQYEFAQGHVFAARKFEAVIGSDVAEKEHMGIGSKFRATHGMPGPNEKPDIHKPTWTVVGVLKPTHTANDRVLFIPLISLYAIEEHDVGLIEQLMLKANFDRSKHTPAEIREFLKQNNFNPDDLSPEIKRRFHVDDVAPPAKTGAASGELMKDAGELMKDKAAAATQTAQKDDSDEPEAYKLDKDGNIVPELPQKAWQLSAVLVKTRSPFYTSLLQYQFQFGNAEASAVNPATVMREFFETFLKGSTEVLLIVSRLVMLVAGVSILVSIYNSVSARMREIAILRALGATRGRVLTLICTEAAVVGFLGAVLGLIVGHLVGAIESGYFQATLGQSIDWFRVSQGELSSLILAVVIAALAGLVPAMKAYRTPVAVNLVS
jgi:putative ABC transport system permease protein